MSKPSQSLMGRITPQVAPIRNLTTENTLFKDDASLTSTQSESDFISTNSNTLKSGQKNRLSDTPLRATAPQNIEILSQNIEKTLEENNLLLQENTEQSKKIQALLLQLQQEKAVSQRMTLIAQQELRQRLDIANHLNALVNSRGWRLLQTLWNYRLKIIPRSSRREAFLKQIVNLKQPASSPLLEHKPHTAQSVETLVSSDAFYSDLVIPAPRILKESARIPTIEPLRAVLDEPSGQTIVPAVLQISGWALAFNEQPKIEVLLNNQMLGLVQCSVERLDVAALFPEYGENNCGFSASYEIPSGLTGEQTVTVTITNKQGESISHQRRVIVCHDPYHLWQIQNEPDEAKLIQQRKDADLFPFKPLISVVTPVYNPQEEALRSMIKSVLKQTWEHWELCLVDGKSTHPDTRKILEEYALQDSRIKIVFLDKNLGISGNTNVALKMARGDYLAFLDHDDELAANALFENVALLNETPDFDIIYSDQDKMDEAGRRFEPFFKPDWSPEYFRSVMYVGHLLCVRRELALKVGEHLSKFDGVQDYEYMLRLSEHTNRIAHLPMILYHWRVSSQSLAGNPEAKKGINELQQMAVNAQLTRLKLPGKAEKGCGHHRVKITPRIKRQHKKISIIIPSKDSPDHLARCLQSIYSKTTWKNFEIILVDNETTDQRALAIMRDFGVRRVPFTSPFNYSRANNLGVEHAEGALLVFLNNDTEVISPDWLEQLSYFAEQPDVGAVGAMLLYPDRRVQHAGVALGMRGTADHLMRFFPADVDGYAGSLSSAREVTAVTAACLMMKRSDFAEAKGFNAHYFTHYQDVDLCLSLIEMGKRNIQNPHAKLIHYESATRKAYYDLIDKALLLDRWENRILAGDAYYSRHLNIDKGDYSLKST